ncbi:MAG: response regulator [Candidatus Bathyarchaeota archaeon]
MANILVVDDEEDIQSLAEIILKEAGHNVTTAQDGETALDLVGRNRYDLVLLDVILPGISGLDVCRTLKKGKKTRNIPVVMFTALGTGVDMMLEKDVKADGYLQKPFTRRLLLDAIERCIKPVRHLSLG